MKYIRCLAFTVCFMMLAGCAGARSSDPAPETAERTTEAQTQAAVPQTEETTLLPPLPADENNIDLTGEGQILTYARITEIAAAPADYAGKTIRMKGVFVRAETADGGSVCCCMVKDLGGCCMQGLNFEPDAAGETLLSGLQEGDKVIVEGVYEKSASVGYCLSNAKITAVKE